MSAELSKHGEVQVEIGLAGRALPGLSVSGDLHLVQPFKNGLLAAVIDGLGHGDEAAQVSRAAVAVLAQNPAEPLVDLMNRCHKALNRTRGAVVSLASFDAVTQTMSWLGVGNVDGVMIRSRSGTLQRECLPVRRGVVGFKMPALRAAVMPIAGGDTLIMTSDGIASNFLDGVPLTNPAQTIADTMLSRYGKSSDDALVLVVRYLGAAA